MNMHRLDLLKWVAVLAATFILPRPTAFPEAPRPNILMILADDQGWGDLSASGNVNPNAQGAPDWRENHPIGLCIQRGFQSLDAGGRQPHDASLQPPSRHDGKPSRARRHRRRNPKARQESGYSSPDGEHSIVSD